MKKYLFFTLLSLSIFLISPNITSAQTAPLPGVSQSIKDNLEFAGVSAQFSSEQRATDIRNIVVGIINTTLTLFGIAFTILIIYGGWLWMTAAGNQDNIDKAKKVIQWASIGIAIIILSLSASVFIAESLLSASGSSLEL